MPITSMQQDHINNMLGKEGYLWELILTNSSVDLGTKVLYLQRATTQVRETFADFLDLLYQAVPSNVTLIKVLIDINNLCFNYEIRQGPVIQFNFIGISPVDATGHMRAENIMELQDVIKQEIFQRITELCDGHEEEVETQKNAREAVEADIVPKTRWRRELGFQSSNLGALSGASAGDVHGDVIHDIIFAPPNVNSFGPVLFIGGQPFRMTQFTQMAVNSGRVQYPSNASSIWQPSIFESRPPVFLPSFDVAAFMELFDVNQDLIEKIKFINLDVFCSFEFPEGTSYETVTRLAAALSDRGLENEIEQPCEIGIIQHGYRIALSENKAFLDDWLRQQTLRAARPASP